MKPMMKPNLSVQSRAGLALGLSLLTLSACQSPLGMPGSLGAGAPDSQAPLAAPAPAVPAPVSDRLPAAAAAPDASPEAPGSEVTRTARLAAPSQRPPAEWASAAPSAPSAADTPALSPASPASPAPLATPAAVALPATGGLHTLFGNQSVPRTADGSLATGYGLVTDLGLQTIREGWNWKNLETGDNQYVSWMNYFDTKAATLAKMGVAEQAMVCDTPAWASTNGSPYGVPKGLDQPVFANGSDTYTPGVAVNPNNYYARYLFNLVGRYKGEVKYWQVWNEPDFPSGDQGAGTIGSNGNTRFWDGSVADYVRMLKVSAAIVHGLDPAAKVTLGGLGYEGYLAAILDQGGAAYFDVVDFHAYGTDKTSSNGVLNSAWGLMGRYNAMKGVLASHGVTGKTLSISETAMTANNPAEQAAYATKLVATSLGLGDIELAQWAVFTNPGFNNDGLVDAATLAQKTRGYNAYKTAIAQLANCRVTGAVSAAGVQGYAFQRADGKPVWVVWASGTGAAWSPPSTASQVLDSDGQPTGESAGNLTLSSSPRFVIGS